MISENIFKRAFWSLVIMGVVNWISYKLYLYWTVWWIDTISHFFGGMAVSLAVLWLFSLKFDITKWSKKRLILVSILTTILVGILWEIYELYFYITSFYDGIYYLMDTSSDLIMDTVGGIFGYIIVKKLLKKYE